MKKISQGFLLFCICFFLFGHESSAMDKMNMSFYPIYPENQSKEVRGYFSLEAGNKKEQTLELEVYNHETTKKTISVHITNALTTENGGILYVPDEKAGQSKLLHSQFAMRQYVKTEEKITLQPKERKKIKLHITYPKERVGTYLGGILFKEEKEIESVEEKEGTFIHQQSFSGIALQFNFKQKEEIKLTHREIQTELTPTIKRVSVGFENKSSNLIQDATLAYEIFDGEKKLFDGKNTDVDIAPMSAFYYPINWNHESIEDGHYTIKAHLTLNGKQQGLPEQSRTLLTLEEEFEIKPEAIQKVLEMEQSIDPKPVNKEERKQKESKEKREKMMFIILITTIVFLVALLLFILFKKKKRNEGESEE